MASVKWRRAAALLGAVILTLSLSNGLPAADVVAGVATSASASAADPGSSPAADPKAILQELRSFATTGTVLHVAAHPDDENTELITWLSRGRGFRTAYLSLTRGDGGQNAIGDDLDEKLGVLRTQELLAGRRLDGGRQFFTRAIDFGYSKTPEETLRFWDRDQVLADVVRIYRQFRPDVIVTRFPIPPGSGGHGQHTASGILAVEAFKISRDPTAYPEQLNEGLTPWQPKRVLWNSFRIGNAPPGLDGPVFRQDIGGTDPVTGEEFGTIAARSRSMHKTQGLAGAINRARSGPNEQSFMLLAGEPAASDLMDGVDTTWARYPGGEEIGQLAEQAIATFKPDDPAASVPALLELRQKLGALHVDPLVTDKRAQLDRILQSCLGLTVRTTAESTAVVPGETLVLKTSARIDSEVPVRWAGPSAWDSPPVPLMQHGPPAGTLLLPGKAQTNQTVATVPVRLPVTQPYWLREDGAAGISRVADSALIGQPENPPVLTVEHHFAIGGQTLIIVDEVVSAPDAAGSQPHHLDVIPPVSLDFEADVFLVAPGASKPVTIEITAARPGQKGKLSLDVPAGWSASPAAQDFQLAKAGDKAALTFTLSASAQAGAGRIIASAEVGGRRWSHQRIELRYDHLPVQLLQPPVTARLVSIEAKTERRLVGYLPGAGDSTAEAIEQLGYSVRTLLGADLTPEKLAGIRVVVIGVRAFNERDDLKDNLPGLFAWVEQGGTVIAQYNRPGGSLAPLGPYPLSLQGSAPANRVTDETAPVSFLAPDHPALNTPNRITAADFDGWVQERGAYFPSQWDEAHYKSILAMSDPGETQPSSSLLVAKHGQGRYVYTSLSFFRQLPAGVPGAYRLLANLLSLGE